MTYKVETAMRPALEAKRYTHLADIEVHRARCGYWHPRHRPLYAALTDRRPAHRRRLRPSAPASRRVRPRKGLFQYRSADLARWPRSAIMTQRYPQLRA
jgi:hypothetical protein